MGWSVPLKKTGTLRDLKSSQLTVRVVSTMTLGISLTLATLLSVVTIITVVTVFEVVTV